MLLVAVSRRAASVTYARDEDGLRSYRGIARIPRAALQANDPKELTIGDGNGAAPDDEAAGSNSQRRSAVARGTAVALEPAADMRSAIREEVASIAPFDRLERLHREDALAWIDSGVELCRIQKPATPPKHLVSYFVLVDDDHVLLVDHRNAQLWLPSGGHVEPGEHPRATVARELREELGLELADDPGAPLMLTSTETVGTTAGHTDVSLWYVIDADRRVSLGFDTGEFQSVRWFQFAEAPVSRSDPHLARFLGKLALTSRSTRPRAQTRAAG
jgi:8-oxo-dGTP diphosphatase